MKVEMDHICPICRNRAGKLWFDPRLNERNYAYEDKIYYHEKCLKKKKEKENGEKKISETNNRSPVQEVREEPLVQQGKESGEQLP